MVFLIASLSNRFEDGDTLLLNANRFLALGNVRKSLSKRINIRLDQHQNEPELIQNIFKLAKDNKGYSRLIFYLDDGNTMERVVANNCQVNPSKGFMNGLRDLTTKRSVWIS